jgi:hypothetical protein
MVIPAAAIGVGSAIGSALLALWFVVRFRGFGPQTIRSAMIACAAGIVLMQGISPAMGWAVESTNPALALLFVAVPVLGFAFWSGGVLARAALNARQ